MNNLNKSLFSCENVLFVLSLAGMIVFGIVFGFQLYYFIEETLWLWNN